MPTNPTNIFAFIDSITSSDQTEPFHPHEGAIIKQLLGDLDWGGWTTEVLEGMRPVLRELGRINNRFNATLLEARRAEVEAKFEGRSRLAANTLRVKFDLVFDGLIDELFENNRELWVAEFRRRTFARLALLMLYSAWQGQAKVCFDHCDCRDEDLVVFDNLSATS